MPMKKIGYGLFALLLTLTVYIGMPNGHVFAGPCDSLGSEAEKCRECFDQGKTWTALGCLDTSGGGFIEDLFQLGVGIGGGVALILIIFGAFKMMTSAGNPEHLNEGKELVTAAITGLLFIIFSVFLLKLIGYDILHIPGFSS